MSVRILVGDCRDLLRTLPDECVHCVVTSPPYWGLRDYGIGADAFGLEPTYQLYVEHAVEVFREVRRVLRKDGTLWLNLGDSYLGHTRGGVQRAIACDKPDKEPSLKSKDLCGIPWRVAFALQADGWWLRQDIIWAKPNPMPESVTDRCTKAHEYMFLLSKSERYYFDADAIAEKAKDNASRFNGGHDGNVDRQDNGRQDFALVTERNKRSVWTVTTQPYSEAHFATFPPALIEPCILAGTSEKGCCAKCGTPWMRNTERTAMVIQRSTRTHELGQTRSSGTMVEPAKSVTTGWSPSCPCNADVVPCTVLDPFGGAGTTGLVADRLKRNAILIELNPAYAKMAEQRLKGDAGMFADVSAGAAA